MSLQDTFYLVGIIFMALYSLSLIAIVVLLFMVVKRIGDVYKKIEDQILTVKNIVTHPREIVEIAGLATADMLLDRITKLLKPNKKS